jgi:predicted SprT family Zn-dependent metalloprotease
MEIMRKKKNLCKKVEGIIANYDLFGPMEETLARGPDITHRPGSDNPIDLALPSEGELTALFADLNRKYFQDSLVPTKITYSRRMLAAGLYIPQKREIRIGVKYHLIFPDEIVDTLKHEMIHLVDLTHGRKFRSIARRIGASIRGKSHPELRLPAKYIYICPICGRNYPRRKRIRMASCGICSKGGRFDLDCKLKSLKNKSLRKRRQFDEGLAIK